MKTKKVPSYVKGGSRRKDKREIPRKARENKPSGPSRRPQGRTADRAERMSPSERIEHDGEDRFEFVVVGKNPVMEALKSDLQIEKLLILKDNQDHVLKDARERAKKKGLVVQSVEKSKLEELADGLPHQGIAALLAPFPYQDLNAVLDACENVENPLFVIVDHVTDPHNFGAIIRSANVCGAQGVIFPARRSAGLSPAAVKASAGAAAHTPLIKVTNLGQTIDHLKERGYWIGAADMGGTAYDKCSMTGKTALILGAEDGLSPALKKKSDYIVSIPVYGDVDSMNVSCASAVILAEAARQRFTGTK